MPFILLLLLIPSLTFAETSLWRISNGKDSLNLGGSVHLLGQADYPLPDEFEQAFRESGILVLETDLAALTKPEVQVNLAKRLMYQNGVTLKTKLKRETYQALLRYCRSVRFPVSALTTMKPALVVLTLTLTKLQKLGVASGTGVDQFFLQKAQAQGKPVSGLESVETQIKTLESMGEGQEDKFILSTIKDLKKTDVFLTKITKAWRFGDLSQMERIGLKPMRDEFPKLNQSLLTTRNNAWLDSIGAMLKTPQREFVLVGALHLVGEQGLLAQLKQKGYRVEQY